MYKRLCGLKIQTRLFFIIFIAVSAFLITASIILLRDNETTKNANNFSELADIAPTIGQLIHELQKERGTSAIYISEAASEPSKKILTFQKNTSDLIFNKFKNITLLSNDGIKIQGLNEKVDAATKELNGLEKMRLSVSKLELTTAQMTTYYTNVIGKLLSIIAEMGKFSSNTQITGYFVAYQSFMEAIERAGQERAIGAAIFNAKAIDPKNINKFITLIAQQEAYLHIFSMNASTESIRYADKIVRGLLIQEHQRLRNIAINIPNIDQEENVKGTQWFKVITSKIDQMKQVEDHLVKELVGLSQNDKNIASNRFFIILLGGFIAIGAITGGAYIIARSISNPLNQITCAMHRISSGDLEQNVPHLEMKNSVGEIARALFIFKLKVIENIALEKQAVEQLKKGEERERLKFEIKKSEKARKELVKLKDKAEVANKTKNEFLSNMSHELRTPLNAIIGFSDVLRYRMLGDDSIERYEEYATDINVSAIHLLDIINDILDLSKVEANKVELSLKEVSLGEIIRPIISIMNQRIQEKEIVFQVDDKQLQEINLKVDKKRFKQILLNILSNAIKFTLEGGEVTISAETSSGNGFSLVIQDNGIGMDPADIPKAMSPFSQIDSAFNRQYEGTGLGLPLAKQLTELHAGKLDIESQLGMGTIVTVWLPSSCLLMGDAPLIANG